MQRSIHWQIPFADLSGTKYCIDIYDEYYSGDPIQLIAGDTPFTTEEDDSDDFFSPIRSQTGVISVCTALPGGGLLNIGDVLPEKPTDRPIVLRKLNTNGVPISNEWCGFLSCESYSQDYIGIPQNISINVLSFIETLKSIELDLELSAPTTVQWFINDIIRYIDEAYLNEGYIYSMQANYSASCQDVLSKYIFLSRFLSYLENESDGAISYVYKGESLYNILEKFCQFMGWCLREQGNTLYFTRLWTDEIGVTSANMSSLQWKGTGHKRSTELGKSNVLIEADLKEFKVEFNFPTCPTSGLVSTYYKAGSPTWYYGKCTRASVGTFTSNNVNNCFLARFYGIMNQSSMPWNVIQTPVDIDNAIYLAGHEYSDSSFVKLCTIRSVIDFAAICGVENTVEDVGYFTLKLSEYTSESWASAFIRCSFKWNGLYYTGLSNPPYWSSNPAAFKLMLEKGKCEHMIPMPKTSGAYTIGSSEIEVSLYDDFSTAGSNHAIVTDINIDYTPPYKKYQEDTNKNSYAQNLSGGREDESIKLEFASSVGNVNCLSHIYGIKRYTYGQEYVDYIEPITELTYTKPDSTTESRRPEVDLLNRLAEYYGESRQSVKLECAHPTTAPLPLLKLNGINDGKVYLPLSERRDWKTEVCTLTCFECPQEPSES